jgi:iron(II)-dependent oxidoreductase
MTEGKARQSFDAAHEAIVDALAKVRQRTLDLVAPLSDAGLREQHSPLMSPIAWDLGHIAEFEDLWLVRRLGEVVGESALPEAYDAMRTPRSRRAELDLPNPGTVLERLDNVRRGALAMLQRVDLAGSENHLLRDGFVYELVREHEAQHQETILQTISLMESEPYVPVSRVRFEPSGSVPAGEMVAVPAGSFEMGAPSGPFTYDNERPRHTASTGPFEIGRFPVTNGEYLEFVASGGYDDPALWTSPGWSWKDEAGLAAPRYWRPSGFRGLLTSAAAAEVARSGGTDAWELFSSLGSQPLRPTDPVVHVCHYEAEAYARFAGARLPAEAEWEKAAVWDPDTGESAPYPWGTEPPGPDLANLGTSAFGVAPIGTFPAGRSPVGCEQMLGDTWEWTSSPFVGYPGFTAYPYDEYSAVFFGTDYVVLRGASWATDEGVARNTFRNWDYPIRRQIFAGFRIARGESR